MKKFCSALFIFLAALLSSPAMSAGIENIRWRTTFKSPSGDGACDLYIFNMNQAYTYPTNGTQPDGVLTITQVQNDSFGRINKFRGTWSRGGAQGTFSFNPMYNGNAAAASQLLGFYFNDSVAPGIAFPWNGYP